MDGCFAILRPFNSIASYQDDVRVVMGSFVQWNLVYRGRVILDITDSNCGSIILHCTHVSGQG